MRIIGYCRVSTKKQVRDGVSLSMQTDKIREYIDMLELHDQVSLDIYVDDGYSAHSLERPRMKQMIRQIQSNGVDVIITYDLSRLSRDVLDTEFLLRLISEHQVQLKCIYDTPSMQTAIDRFRTRITSANNALQREIVAEKTFDALQNIVNSGRYASGGSLPIGYKRLEDKNIAIDEESRHIVEEIFRMAMQRYPVRLITEMVNDSQSNRTYSCESIRDVIYNRKYSGHYIFNNKDYPDIVPAIVTDDVQRKAMEMIRTRAGKSSKYLYSQNLICTSCGILLNCTCSKKKNGKVYYYYVCKECKKSIPQTTVNEQLMNIDARLELGSEIMESQLKLLKRKKNGFTYRMSLVEFNYLNNLYTNDEYLALVIPLQKKIEKLDEDISKLELEIGNGSKESPIDLKLLVDNFIHHIEVDLDKKEISRIEYKNR